jgi:hypothetical protein
VLQGTLPHPLDNQAPDVPTSCVVYFATSDGALRMCHLANFKQQQGLARDPQPVPTTLPQQLVDALAAAGRLAMLDEVGGGHTRGQGLNKKLQVKGCWREVLHLEGKAVPVPCLDL